MAITVVDGGTRLQSWAARVPPSGLPILTGVVGLAAVITVASVSPYEQGNYPTCPSLALTGTYCPGCGSMRAVHDLAHMNFVGALEMNPMIFFAVPYLAWSWVRWLASKSGFTYQRRLAPAWVIYAVAGTIVAFWIARNVPALQPYLAP